MSDMSDFYAAGSGAHLVDGTPFSAPTTLYCALLTSAPSDAGLGAGEVTGAGYARQLLTGNMLLSTTPPLRRANDGIIDFGTASSDWGIVGWLALIDHISNATPFFSGKALAEALDIRAGDTVRFPINDLGITWE
jgi:hypothetical protein